MIQMRIKMKKRHFEAFTLGYTLAKLKNNRLTTKEI
jgi:hypothetical protein